MSLVKQAIKVELNEAIQKSLEFIKARNEAKTDYKKQYFNKKLAENNLLIADMVQALDRLEQKEKQNEPTTTEAPPATE